MKVLAVSEMFGNTIQGEGMYTGIPSIFVRTTGCNLRCVFKDSICDTAYTSFNPEKPLYDNWDDLMDAFKKLVNENPRVNHLVITGGESLLMKDSLEEFLRLAFEIKDDWVVSLETNGSLPMLNPLGKGYKVDLYSVSPKLSTSVDWDCKFLTEAQRDHHNKTRINYKNLYNIVKYSRNYQFKFVYSGPECIDEIKDIYSKMAEFVNKEDDYEFENWIRKHPNKHTQLMPEGITNEQLSHTREEAVKACVENGWRFCDREHIVIWGDKRGV